MSEEERPLITPSLLDQLREDEEAVEYNDMAESLADWVPKVVTYDILLKSMLAGKMQISLRFVESKAVNLSRIKSLCAHKLNAFLGTLVDLRCYDWNLVCGEVDGRGMNIDMMLCPRQAQKDGVQ